MIAQYRRPCGQSAAAITDTQFIHEWADHLLLEGDAVIDASRGKPSFSASAAGLQAFTDYTQSLTKSQLSLYGTDTLGEWHYREKVAEAFTRDYGAPFNAASIAFTPGGQFGLAMAFTCLYERWPEAQIAAPRPWYLNHRELAMTARNMMHLSDCEPFVALDWLHDERIGLDPQAIAALAEQPEIKALLLCDPANPLGTVISHESWCAIAQLLARRSDMLVILDAAFEETRFDATIPCPHPVLSRFGDRCVLLRSGTKALGFPGERLAVMHVPPCLMGRFTFLQSRLIGHPAMSAQAVMSEIMQSLSPEERQRIAAYYHAHAKQLYETLNALGLSIHPQAIPQGGFFTLMDASQLLGQLMPEGAARMGAVAGKPLKNDWDIAIAMLFGLNQPKRSGIAAMPASCFGIDAEKGWLRVSFSICAADIDLLCQRLHALFA